MEERILKIMLLGQQGCGKGTQAERLSKKFNIPRFSTGDMFREEIRKESEIGKLAAFYIDNGNLVPNEVTDKILAEKLVSTCGLENKNCGSGFILDGYPRDIDQAIALEKITDLTHVIEIHISEDESRERILGRRICPKCGANYHLKYKRPKVDGICEECGSPLTIRKDSTQEVVNQRFKVYYEKTAPLLYHYREKGILYTVEGQGEIEDVFERVSKLIEDNG